MLDTPTPSRNLASSEGAFDALFVVGWPLLLGLHAWAVRSPSALLVPGFELVLLRWVATSARPNGARLDRVARVASALFLLAGFARTLPEVWSSSACVRYRTTEWLGATWADFPIASVALALLALGPAHLAAERLSEYVSAEGTRRLVVYDAYFGGTALLATLVIAEYAGGPLFP